MLLRPNLVTKIKYICRVCLIPGGFHFALSFIFHVLLLLSLLKTLDPYIYIKSISIYKGKKKENLQGGWGGRGERRGIYLLNEVKFFCGLKEKKGGEINAISILIAVPCAVGAVEI